MLRSTLKDFPLDGLIGTEASIPWGALITPPRSPAATANLRARLRPRANPRRRVHSRCPHGGRDPSLR